MSSSIRKSSCWTGRSIDASEIVVIVVNNTAETKSHTRASKAWRHAGLTHRRVLEEARRTRGNTGAIVKKVRRSTRSAVGRCKRASGTIIRTTIAI